MTKNKKILFFFLCVQPNGLKLIFEKMGGDKVDHHFSLVRNGIIPTVLLVWSPLMVLCLGGIIRGNGGFRWESFTLGSWLTWQMVFIFASIQLLLMRILPGPIVYGPPSPHNFVPRYKANGVLAFVVTIIMFIMCSDLPVIGGRCVGFYKASIVFDHYQDLLGTLNAFSMVLCVALYVKGRWWPTSDDCKVTGYLPFDYFWGSELHPYVFGWPVKMFTNCRMAMMGWPIIIISFAAGQYETHGFVSDGMMVAVAIQLVYIGKFFWWETGYLQSLDIMHDRAGFYICWGCMAWLPAVYTSPTLFIAIHPNNNHTVSSIWLLTIGVVCIVVNYQADMQRRLVRDTNGNCTIWGKRASYIRAQYRTECGKEKSSILLTSGWWAVSRHFHYIPELGVALCISLASGTLQIEAYLYFIFLCVLLTDRSIRDDQRCAKKYTHYWDRYKRIVPWNIIPYIF